MKQERAVPLTPAMEKAVNELKGTISERFPQASFVVEEGFDPKGIYLVTTVDIADTDMVAVSWGATGESAYVGTVAFRSAS